MDQLAGVPDIREWVLQRYIEHPLLIQNGHKFHLRVYALCVGALKVYVFDKILMLIAACKYCLDDLDNIYAHLTNTARAAENLTFDEKKFVQLLDDLPHHLMRYCSDRVSDLNTAYKIVDNIYSQVHSITGELFKAFENEYTIFCPMTNCFEIYGLDYLVDADFNVYLLEVNPGGIL